MSQSTRGEAPDTEEHKRELIAGFLSASQIEEFISDINASLAPSPTTAADTKDTSSNNIDNLFKIFATVAKNIYTPPPDTKSSIDSTNTAATAAAPQTETSVTAVGDTKKENNIPTLSSSTEEEAEADINEKTTSIIKKYCLANNDAETILTNFRTNQDHILVKDLILLLAEEMLEFNSEVFFQAKQKEIAEFMASANESDDKESEDDAKAAPKTVIISGVSAPKVKDTKKTDREIALSILTSGQIDEFVSRLDQATFTNADSKTVPVNLDELFQKLIPVAKAASPKTENDSESDDDEDDPVKIVSAHAKLEKNVPDTLRNFRKNLDKPLVKKLILAFAEHYKVTTPETIIANKQKSVIERLERQAQRQLTENFSKVLADAENAIDLTATDSHGQQVRGLNTSLLSACGSIDSAGPLIEGLDTAIQQAEQKTVNIADQISALQTATEQFQKENNALNKINNEITAIKKYLAKEKEFVINSSIAIERRLQAFVAESENIQTIPKEHTKNMVAALNEMKTQVSTQLNDALTTEVKTNSAYMTDEKTTVPRHLTDISEKSLLIIREHQKKASDEIKSALTAATVFTFFKTNKVFFNHYAKLETTLNDLNTRLTTVQEDIDRLTKKLDRAKSATAVAPDISGNAKQSETPSPEPSAPPATLAQNAAAPVDVKDPTEEATKLLAESTTLIKQIQAARNALLLHAANHLTDTETTLDTETALDKEIFLFAQKYLGARPQVDDSKFIEDTKKLLLLIKQASNNKLDYILTEKGVMPRASTDAKLELSTLPEKRAEIIKENLFITILPCISNFSTTTKLFMDQIKQALPTLQNINVYDVDAIKKLKKYITELAISKEKITRYVYQFSEKYKAYCLEHFKKHIKPALATSIAGIDATYMLVGTKYNTIELAKDYLFKEIDTLATTDKSSLLKPFLSFLTQKLKEHIETLERESKGDVTAFKNRVKTTLVNYVEHKINETLAKQTEALLNPQIEAVIRTKEVTVSPPKPRLLNKILYTFSPTRKPSPAKYYTYTTVISPYWSTVYDIAYDRSQRNTRISEALPEMKLADPLTAELKKIEESQKKDTKKDPKQEVTEKETIAKILETMGIKLIEDKSNNTYKKEYTSPLYPTRDNLLSTALYCLAEYKKHTRDEQKITIKATLKKLVELDLNANDASSTLLTLRVELNGHLKAVRTLGKAPIVSAATNPFAQFTHPHDPKTSTPTAPTTAASSTASTVNKRQS